MATILGLVFFTLVISSIKVAVVEMIALFWVIMLFSTF
jgi:hypothetical protein